MASSAFMSGTLVLPLSVCSTVQSALVADVSPAVCDAVAAEVTHSLRAAAEDAPCWHGRQCCMPLRTASPRGCGAATICRLGRNAACMASCTAPQRCLCSSMSRTIYTAGLAVSISQACKGDECRSSCCVGSNPSS